MCRILAFHVKGEVDKEALEALRLASKNDTLSIYGNHPDGWGISALIREGNEWNLLEYKTSKPAFNDPFFDSLRLKGEEIYGIVHARKARTNFLLGVAHSHPYHIRVNGYDIFFAHNGSINRKVFNDPMRPYTDSYMMLDDIASYVSSGLHPVDAYEKEYMKVKEFSSSLNSAMLYMRGKEVKLTVLHYFNVNMMKEKNEEYYHLYCNESYCMSSSLMKYLPPTYAERIPPGFKLM